MGSDFVCGCSSMVERQPSKLVAWVRFPSPAPYLFDISVFSSAGQSIALLRRGSGVRIPQGTPLWWMQRSWLERKIVDLEVVGSSPTFHPTIIKLNIGVQPSGKAIDFDSIIRRFESCHPSQLKTHESLGCRQVVRHGTLTPTFEGSKPSTPAKILNMVHQLSRQST